MKTSIEKLRVERFAGGSTDFSKLLATKANDKAMVDALLDKVVAIALDAAKAAVLIIHGYSDRMATGNSTDAERKTELDRSEARAVSAVNYSIAYLEARVPNLETAGVQISYCGLGADWVKYETTPNARNRAVSMMLVAFDPGMQELGTEQSSSQVFEMGAENLYD